MKIDIYTYRCEPFGHVFQAYRLPPISYGEFLLRDETGASMAYLNALVDPTLVEVVSIVEKLSKSTLTMNDCAEIAQRIYGVAACDPDIQGRPFKIGQFPRCPICSSTSMRSWAFTNPPEWAEINVPSVTHKYWDLLSDEQKYARVESMLS